MAETISDRIANIDTAIDNIIAASDTSAEDDISAYKIGDKSVQKNQKLAGLLKLREYYEKLLRQQPTEDIRELAYEYGEFGEDLSETIGDAK